MSYGVDLSPGEHTLAVISENGLADGAFTIVKGVTESGNNGNHTVIIPDTSVR